MAEVGGGGRESFLKRRYSPGWSKWPQMLDLPAIAFLRAKIIGIRISVYGKGDHSGDGNSVWEGAG